MVAVLVKTVALARLRLTTPVSVIKPPVPAGRSATSQVKLTFPVEVVTAPLPPAVLSATKRYSIDPQDMATIRKVMI
jgi:hypothetical protein